MKVCQKCREPQPEGAFYKRTSSPDGLQNRCKSCQHADSVRRARADPKKQAASAHRWKQQNPEKVKAYRREWARDNPDVSQKWRRENPELFAITNRASKVRVRESLGESYVRHLIAKRIGCSNKDVPADLVQAKRAHVSLKRLILKKEKADADQ